MAKVTLSDITSGYSSSTTVNANNALVAAAVENTLSLDGTSPNQMGADLDMNSNAVTNLSNGANNQDAVTVAQLAAATVVANTTTAALTTIADSGTNYTATTVEGALAEVASVATGEGASIIGVEDSAGNMAATNVEAALAEIYTDYVAADAVVVANYALTTNSNGASLVGVEDAAGDYTGADVEAVLAEIAANYVTRAHPSEVVTTTNVITASESGKTFYLNTAGGFTSTLPAPAIGLKYKFIVSTAPTTAYIVTTNAGANVLYGTLLDIVGEQVAVTAQDTVNFVANTSLVGDSLEVESDGTNWYVAAKSLANGGMTVAAT